MNKFIKYLLLLNILLFVFFNCSVDQQKNNVEDIILEKKIYYSDGNLWKKGNYDNEGKKHLNWFTFNKDGNLIRKENWLHGKYFGEQIYYYNNNRIKIYAYVDFQEIIVFKRTYDNKGSIKDSFGKFFTMLVSDWDKLDNIQLTDTVNFDIYIASPPECNNVLFYKLFIDNELKELDTIPIKETKANYSYIINERANYRIEFKVETFDKIYNKKTSEDAKIDFIVD